jgi:hypothetical protein
MFKNSDANTQKTLRVCIAKVIVLWRLEKQSLFILRIMTFIKHSVGKEQSYWFLKQVVHVLTITLERVNPMKPKLV